MFIDYKRLFVCELVLLCFPGLTFVSAVRVGALGGQMKPSPGSMPHPPVAAVLLARWPQVRERRRGQKRRAEAPHALSVGRCHRAVLNGLRKHVRERPLCETLPGPAPAPAIKVQLSRVATRSCQGGPMAGTENPRASAHTGGSSLLAHSPGRVLLGGLSPTRRVRAQARSLCGSPVCWSLSWVLARQRLPGEMGGRTVD